MSSYKNPRPPMSSSSGASPRSSSSPRQQQHFFQRPRTVDGWVKAAGMATSGDSLRQQVFDHTRVHPSGFNTRAASARAMAVAASSGQTSGPSVVADSGTAAGAPGAGVFGRPLSNAKRQKLSSVASNRPPPEAHTPIHLRAVTASDAYRGIMKNFEEQRSLFSSTVISADAAFREVCQVTAADSRRGRPNPIRAAVACGLLKRLLPSEGDSEAGRLMHELTSEIARAIFDLGDTADEEDDEVDATLQDPEADEEERSAALAALERKRNLLDDQFDALMLRPLFFQQVAVTRDEVYESRAAVRKLKATIKKQATILDSSIDRWQRMLVARVFSVWRKHVVRHRANNFEGRFRLLSRNQAKRLSAKVFMAWRAITAAENLSRKKDEIRVLKLEMQRQAAAAQKTEQSLEAEITRLVDASEALSATVATLRDDVGDLAQQLEQERRRCDTAVTMGDRWREACLQIVSAMGCGRVGATSSSPAAAAGTGTSNGGSSNTRRHNHNKRGQSNTQTYLLDGVGSSNPDAVANNRSWYPELMLLPQEVLPVAFDFSMAQLQTEGVLDHASAKELGMVPTASAAAMAGSKTLADMAMAAAVGAEDSDQVGAAAAASRDGDGGPSSPADENLMASSFSNASMAARRVAAQQQQEAQAMTARLSAALPQTVLQVPVDRRYVFGELRTGDPDADAAIAALRAETTTRGGAEFALSSSQLLAANPFHDLIRLLEGAATSSSTGSSRNSSPLLENTLTSSSSSPAVVVADTVSAGPAWMGSSVSSPSASPLSPSLGASFSKQQQQHHHHHHNPASTPAMDQALARKFAAAPGQVLLLAWVNAMCQQSPLVKRFIDTKRYYMDHSNKHHGGRSSAGSDASGGGGQKGEVMISIEDQQGSGAAGGFGGLKRGASAARKQIQLELSRVVSKCSLGDPATLVAILGALHTLPALPLPARNFAIDWASGDVLLFLAEACGCLTLDKLRRRYGVQELTVESMSEEERQKQERAAAVSMSLTGGSAGAVLTCHPVVARILRARIADVAASSGIKSLAAAEHELLLDAIFAIVVFSDPFDKVDLALRALHDSFRDSATTEMWVGVHRNEVMQGLAPKELRSFVSSVFSAYVDLGVTVNLEHAAEKLLDESNTAKKRKQQQQQQYQDVSSGDDDGEAADSATDSTTTDGEGGAEAKKKKKRRNKVRKGETSSLGGFVEDRRALPLVVAPFTAMAKERRGYQEPSWLCRLSSSVTHEVLAPHDEFPASLADSNPNTEELLMRCVAARVSRANLWRSRWKQITALCQEKLRHEDTGADGSGDGGAGSSSTILNADTQRELQDLRLVSEASLRAVLERFEKYAGVGAGAEEETKKSRDAAHNSSFALSAVRNNPHAPNNRRGSPTTKDLASSIGGGKKFEKPVHWIVAQCKPRGRKLEWPAVVDGMAIAARVLKLPENDKKLRHIFYSYATRSVCSTVTGAVSIGVFYGLSHSQFREFVVECGLHAKPQNAGLTKRSLGALYDTLVSTRLATREQMLARKASQRFAESAAAYRKRDAVKQKESQQQQHLRGAEAGEEGADEEEIASSTRKKHVSIVVNPTEDNMDDDDGGDDDDVKKSATFGSSASLTNFLESDEANLPPGQLALSDLSAILTFVAVSCAFADTRRTFDGALIEKHMQLLIDSLKMRSSARRAERDHFQKELDSFSVQSVFEQHNHALRRAFVKAAGQDGDPEMCLDEWLFVMRTTRLQVLVGADNCRDIFIRFAGGAEGSSMLFRDFLDCLAVISCFIDPNPFTPLSQKIHTVISKGVPGKALPGILSSMGVKTAGA